MTKSMNEDKDTNPSPEQLKSEMVSLITSIRERGKELPRNSLENTNPDLAAKVLWLLSQNASYTEIRRITGVGSETVRRLDWEHSANNVTFDEQRKRFASRYAMAAMEYTDLLFKRAEQLHDNPELLEQISPEKLATVVGIMQDKASSLAGATSADANAKAGLSIEDARALIEAAAQKVAEKKRNKTIDAEVVDA